jgi:hypothetical protein
MITIGGVKTTLNHLEKEGILELLERKVIDKRGNETIKYFAKIPDTNKEFEITPVAYKSMIE